MEEKVSSELKLVELRKESFRRTLDQLRDRASSLILLTLQWKDIEDNFDSIHNAIEERAKELHLVHDSVQLKLEEVQQRENRLEERFREIEAREKEFELYQKKEVEERETEIEWIESSRREVVAVSESIERKLKLLEEKEKKVELLNDSIDEKASQVSETEREVSQALKDIEAKEKQCEQFFNELKLKEEQVEERSKIVARKDENFSKLLLELKAKEKKLEQERQELGSKADKFKDLELKEKQIQARCEEMEMEKKKFMERCKEVELKEKQLNEWCKEFELKGKHLVDGHSYPSVVNYAKDYPPDANLHFTVNMDGRALQVFLNEHSREYDSMRNEVLIALGLSSDPAKLVLDAMQGFYPPHLEKDDKQFEEEVVRRNCILLLEQLMKVRTEIKPAVKKEAMRLAFDWITKMKVDAEHFIEIIGFLQLLASYGLASAFDADELLTQLEIVARHSQAPELFRVLGFGDKISGFIENLITKKQYVEAIRFIYAFELVSEFPPVPLLNDYLKDSKNAAKRLRRRTKSLEGQIEAANKRIADLRCALGCIEDFKIEYGPSLGNLKRLVECFEKENSKRKANLAVPGHKVGRTPHNNKKKLLAPTIPVKDAYDTACATSPISTCFLATTSTSVPVTNSQSQQLSGNKRPWTVVSAEGLNACRGANQVTCTVPIHVKLEQSFLGDLPLESKEACGTVDPQPKPKCFSVNTSEENLRRLLNMLENHQLEDGEIAAALRSARDPGKLVLDVMNIYFPFKLKRNKDFKSHIPEKNFIFLLEQLRKVLPQINAEIKEQAKKFALLWKTIVAKNRKGPMEVICFLQFLAAYRLATIFNADELLGLLDTDHWRKEAPNLCRLLGLAEKIPSFIKDCIKKEQHLEAVKYIYALDVVDEFPPLSILKNHLINSSKKRGKTIGTEIVDIVREIKSLRNVIKCIADYKISGLSAEDLNERIVQLEKQKTEKFKIQASEVKVEQFCASAPNTQRQHQSGDKRPRIHISSEDPPKASIGSISAVYSMPPPLQHPPGSFTSQGVACTPPPGHYSLAAYPGYPSYNMPLNSSGASVISSYHWSAFANPGHDRSWPYSTS